MLAMVVYLCFFFVSRGPSVCPRKESSAASDLYNSQDLRIDVDIKTTTSNQHAKVSLELAIGATPYEISILDRDFKTATTHANITVSNFFYIGNEITKNYPAKLKFTSDASANITLNGFAVIVTKRK